MKFTKQISERILNELKVRNAPKRCVICSANQWTLVDGFFFHGVQFQLPNMVIGHGAGMPCAALVCQNCGNTHFINLITLGFHNVMQPDP